MKVEALFQLPLQMVQVQSVHRQKPVTSFLESYSNTLHSKHYLSSILTSSDIIDLVVRKTPGAAFYGLNKVMHPTENAAEYIERITESDTKRH